MTKYQLVKLVALAGTLTSRKRVQKVVHLLQAAGCPLAAEYDLHFYGPYSAHVASLLNELVSRNLLQETCTAHAGGEQYSYTLSPAGAASLANYEQTPAGQAEARRLQPFEGRYQQLLTADLGELELASTIAFYWEQGGDWEQAARRAGVFKKVPANTARMASATRLARSVVRG